MNRRFLSAFVAFFFFGLLVVSAPAYASSSPVYGSVPASVLVPSGTTFQPSISTFANIYRSSFWYNNVAYVNLPRISGGTWYPNDGTFNVSSLTGFPESFSRPFGLHFDLTNSPSSSESFPWTVRFRYVIPANVTDGLVLIGHQLYYLNVLNIDGHTATARWQVTSSGTSGSGTVSTYSDDNPHPVGTPYTGVSYQAYFTDSVSSIIQEGTLAPAQALGVRFTNPLPQQRILEVCMTIPFEPFSITLPSPSGSDYTSIKLLTVQPHILPFGLITSKLGEWISEDFFTPFTQYSSAFYSSQNTFCFYCQGGTLQNVPEIPGVPTDPENPSPGGDTGTQDAIKDQTEQQKNFFESVLSFFADFFTNLLEGFVHLFVPDEQDILDIKTAYDELLEDRLGLGYQAISFVDTLFTSIYDNLVSNTSYEFTFPGISFPMNGDTIVIAPPTSVSLDNDLMSALRPVAGTAVTLISVLAFVNTCKNFLEKLLGGKNISDSLED